jgi:type IV pilus assembly protein PilC
MKFNYQARTKDGIMQSGVIEAASKEAAIILLQRHDLFVTSLVEIDKAPFYSKKVKMFQRISEKDVVLFSRQLSIMFKAKVPLVGALQSLSNQIVNPNFREIIMKIADEVGGGISFSQALTGYPKLFSEFYVNIIRSGEASGTLSTSLGYLADYLETQYNFSRKIIGAMTYPIFIMFVMLAVVFLMLFFVVPQLGQVLKETGQELPFVTKMVLDSSTFLTKYWWMALLMLSGIGFALYNYVKSSTGKKFFAKNLLKVPIMGKFLRTIYLTRFAENLSVLICSGLPIIRAIDISGSIVGNDVYKKAILKVRDEVKKGETIHLTLAKYPKLFPPLFVQMVSVGEKTGTLGDTLKHIVSFYQKEVDRAIDSLLNIIEPVLILFLGVVVGGLVASILLPMYQMTSL